MRYPETESNLVEFKQGLPRNDQIIKTAIGFCNQHGGQILIGVKDDRTVIGITDKEIERTIEIIDKSLYEACAPPIIPRVYTQRFNDKTILIIEIFEGMHKPYYRRSEGLEKGTYIRLGRHTLRATKDIIEELKWQSRGVDFESLPVYRGTLRDLNEDAVIEFLEGRKNQGKVNLTESIMKGYNLVDEQSKSYPTTLGILLFGKNPQKYFSEAIMICSHFKGTSGREAIATLDCEGTLFNQFHQAFAFITERLYKSFTIKGIKRDEKLEIPEIAIREMLVNAIVHRNYHIKSPTKIAIYDDRLEIFSPGQFPGPLQVADLQNGLSYLRNPMMCKILREAHYIEKLGTGFITLFKSYEERGLPAPLIIEGENFIKCILPRGKASAIKIELSDEEKILQLFNRADEINITDIMQLLSISRATAGRRLNQMVKRKLIERLGSTKAARYKRK